MDVTARLQALLQCTEDDSNLAFKDDAFHCRKCGRVYPFADSILTAVQDSERPPGSKALAENIAENEPSLLSPDYYRERISMLTSVDDENALAGKLIEILPGSAEYVVDLATGPGGGFIPWFATGLDRDVLLVATDACTPVVENWSKAIRDVRKEFAFIDVDLQRSLCFQSGSVDAFTSFFIDNVNIAEPLHLFREVSRCLKENGVVFLRQLLLGESSQTATILRAKGNPYASLTDLGDALRSVKLELEDDWDLRSGVGKLHPADRLPVSDYDEWAEKMLVARKIS